MMSFFEVITFLIRLISEWITTILRLLLITPYHGTIIRTGITCKKIPCYVHDSACRWFIVKKAKIFWSYVKHFWVPTCVRKCRILTGLCNNLFWIAQQYFLTNIIKQSYYQLLFLSFKTNYRYNLSISRN